MARQVSRISDLPEAAPIQGDELLEIVQGGENVRVRADELGGGGGVGEGLPEGGTQGQVLTKLSADDFDADWQTPQSGGGGVSWGAITGNIEDQEDLVLLVDSKIGDIGLILDSINGEIV